jgi:predicted glutamine amidotransferase
MCQLFALNCNVPSAVTFSFTGLSARGGRTGEHADGFGLAFHDDAACRVFIDDRRASDAPLADFLRRHPIRARTVLAHVRKATQGAVHLSNCHPFVREWQGRTWSFCHNGDLAGFQPRLTGHYLPVGTTDSERAFCWILQELRRRFRTRRVPDWRRLAPVISELAATIARHGAFNFLLSDGAALYAHCSSNLFSLARSDPFPTAQLVDDDLVLDLGAINGRGSRMILLATAPLTRNEDWQPLGAGEMQVFADGERVWTSAPPVAAS